MNRIIKRTLVGVITAVLALSVSSCGNDNKSPDNIEIELSENKDAPLGEKIINEVEDGYKLQKKLSDLFKTKEIHIEYEEYPFAKFTFVKKGDNYFVYTDKNDSRLFQQITKDDKRYFVSPYYKAYTDATQATDDRTPYMLKEIANEFKGDLLNACNVKIDGVEFERLKIKTYYDDEKYLYFYNNELKYVAFPDYEPKDSSDETEYNENGVAYMKINKLSITDIDESYFEIPDDYREVDMIEFLGYMNDVSHPAASLS